MSIHRFFYDETEFSPETQITIKNASEIRHIKNVLRLKKGNTILLFNGKGSEVEGAIASITPNEISVHIKSRLPSQKTLRPRIILASALPKRSKFESVVEKCTELGVDEIIPLQTKRTDLKIPKSKFQAKLTRYSKIAINAAKQCNRATIPIIHTIQTLPKSLKYITKNSLPLIPTLNGDSNTPFSNFLPQIGQFESVIVFIGPEGDFTPTEVQTAISKGCKPISLGQTVLKVETAAIITVGCVHIVRQ